MPTVGHLSAWIQVNGVRLPEYATEISGSGTKASCWVPSEAGKNFEICYEDSLLAFGTTTKIYVDGVLLPGGRVVHPMQHRPQGFTTHRGIRIASDSYRPYVFSDCELIEDEEFVSTTSPHVGEILCVINEAKIKGYIKRPHTAKPYDLPPLKIQEREKKGIVHGTQLGSAIDRWSKKKTREVSNIRHLVTFEFKYRPLNVLKADGVVPTGPLGRRVSSRLLHNKSEVIDLTVQEENGSSHSQPSTLSGRPVKREPKRERSMTLADQFVDLTV
ncbi:hypothetical protein HYPSUDRAFT_48906 [Hypholoma sublateritium FD-334 SS-4]|uniref:DUF7918 domain-containing protein n=1 Tax=Hypholoma sublateritium (strain FD-334 SS-4) TaxID=945553 RepID=A0A0D2N6H2_HYPSF|nr:hypothetical protein HYPSUDRAFT_48906 [Hypholoma sublateritium FD-334 SS-4]